MIHSKLDNRKLCDILDKTMEREQDLQQALFEYERAKAEACIQIKAFIRETTIRGVRTGAFEDTSPELIGREITEAGVPNILRSATINTYQKSGELKVTHVALTAEGKLHYLDTFRKFSEQKATFHLREEIDDQQYLNIGRIFTYWLIDVISQQEARKTKV